MKALVIIPAYNEEKNLAKLLEKLTESCPGLDTVVVNDCSADGTSEISRDSGAYVIDLPVNLGIGGAVQAGYRYAMYRGYDAAVQVDGDGQHDPGDLIGLVATARADPGLRIIVGSRMTDPGSMPLIRYWTNRFTSSRISKLAGQAIPDSQCGYRLIHRDCLRVWKPTVFRFDSETEMLIHASRGGMRIGSARIRTIYREGMRPSRIHPVRDSLRYFQMMHRLKHPPEGDGR